MNNKYDYSKEFYGCGDIAIRTMNLLKINKINSRLVAVKTKYDYDGEHDGHTLVEYKGKYDRWILYDSFLGCHFGKDHMFMNLKEVIDLGIDKVEFYYGELITQRFTIFDMNINYWVGRVFQVPLIYKNKKWYMYDRDTIVNSKQKEYKFMKYEKWLKEFYGV